MYRIACLIDGYRDGDTELSLHSWFPYPHNSLRAARSMLAYARQRNSTPPGTKLRIIKETADTVVVYDRY